MPVASRPSLPPFSPKTAAGAECGAAVAHVLWEHGVAGSIPATPTRRGLHVASSAGFDREVGDGRGLAQVL